jgi:hypothetical protein
MLLPLEDLIFPQHLDVIWKDVGRNRVINDHDSSTNATTREHK